MPARLVGFIACRFTGLPASWSRPAGDDCAFLLFAIRFIYGPTQDFASIESDLIAGRCQRASRRAAAMHWVPPPTFSLRAADSSRRLMPFFDISSASPVIDWVIADDDDYHYDAAFDTRLGCFGVADFALWWCRLLIIFRRAMRGCRRWYTPRWCALSASALIGGVIRE